MTRTTRWTAAVVCAGAVSLGVTAGGGGSSGSAAGAAATTKTGGGSPSSGAVQPPDFPVPAVPDVTSLTKQASQTESAIKATTPLPQGLSVTGARCDSSGTVVNRGGVTSLDGDGGGAVVSGSGTKLRNKDGSGTFTDGDVIYSVDKDGDPGQRLHRRDRQRLLHPRPVQPTGGGRRRGAEGRRSHRAPAAAGFR